MCHTHTYNSINESLYLCKTWSSDSFPFDRIHTLCLHPCTILYHQQQKRDNNPKHKSWWFSIWRQTTSMVPLGIILRKKLYWPWCHYFWYYWIYRLDKLDFQRHYHCFAICQLLPHFPAFRNVCTQLSVNPSAFKNPTQYQRSLQQKQHSCKLPTGSQQNFRKWISSSFLLHFFHDTFHTLSEQFSTS